MCNAKRDRLICVLIFPDIYDGKVTLVMGLIWTIILKYQDINKQALLEWVQSQLQRYGDAVEVKNFSDR